jgi:hypothetical protein
MKTSISLTFLNYFLVSFQGLSIPPQSVKSTSRPTKRTVQKRGISSSSLFKKTSFFSKTPTPKKTLHTDEGVAFIDNDDHITSLQESGTEIKDLSDDVSIKNNQI